MSLDADNFEEDGLWTTIQRSAISIRHSAFGKLRPGCGYPPRGLVDVLWLNANCQSLIAALSIHLCKVHAIRELQTGNLAGVKLHLQIGLQDCNVYGFALRWQAAMQARFLQ